MLYGGPTMDALHSALNEFGEPLAPVPFTHVVMGNPGYFAYAYTAQIPNTPPCTYAWLEVRAWDSRLGSSYEEVVARGIGGYGASPLFQAIGGGFCTPDPWQPGLLTGLQSFSLLQVVPEPGTWLLLLLLGAPYVWHVRRRRRCSRSKE